MCSSDLESDLDKVTSASANLKEKVDLALSSMDEMASKGLISAEKTRELAKAQKEYQDALEASAKANPGVSEDQRILMYDKVQAAMKNVMYTASQMGEEVIKKNNEMITNLETESRGKSEALENQWNNSLKAIEERLDSFKKTMDIQGIVKTVGAIGSLGTSITSLGRTLDGLKDGTTTMSQFLIASATQLPMLVMSLNNVGAAFGKLKMITNAMTEAQKAYNVVSGIEGVSSFKKITAAVEAFGKSLIANPMFLVIAGITAITTLLVTYKKRQEEATQATRDFNESKLNLTKEALEEKKAISELAVE